MKKDEAITRAKEMREENACGQTALVAIALLDALESAPVAVPDGWQMVPVEPTEEMAKAYMVVSMKSWPQRYAAMLAAAPQEQAPADKDAIRLAADAAFNLMFDEVGAVKARLLQKLILAFQFQPQQVAK